MIHIPVQSVPIVTRSVTITIEPCPYCGTHEAPEDRDGVWSCPNCGYPLAQDIPLLDEWAQLLPADVPSLAEADWANLLAEAERVSVEVAHDPGDDAR